MTTNTLFTRKQYLDEGGTEAHRRYYAQFVTPHNMKAVVDAIGERALLASTDPAFNDIPLHKWDNLPLPINTTLFADLGDFYTLAGKVCIAKEAARQWVEACSPREP